MPWRSNSGQKGQGLGSGAHVGGSPRACLSKTRVSVSKVKVGDSFTNTYAQKANQREGFTTTTTPAGAAG